MHNFFGGDVTISMYPLPLCPFLSIMLGTPSPYPGDVIFEWPQSLKSMSKRFTYYINECHF